MYAFCAFSRQTPTAIRRWRSRKRTKAGRELGVEAQTFDSQAATAQWLHLKKLAAAAPLRLAARASAASARRGRPSPKALACPMASPDLAASASADRPSQGSPQSAPPRTSESPQP